MNVLALDTKKMSRRTEYERANVETRLWWAAHRRSKDQGLPFNITKEDILVPSHCPYLGIKLTSHAPRGTNRASVASLDKIDPSLGYVKGNIQVISHKANSMKQWATKEELVLFAKYVLENYQ